MRRGAFFIGILTIILSGGALAGCQTMGSASQNQGMEAPAGLTSLFPHVLATLYLEPGQAAKVTVADQYTTGAAQGTMTISIPAGAFSSPVRFDVLASANTDWDSKVSPDLTVIANFAYRVIDAKTGGLVENFTVPATVTFNDPMIGMNSVYWGVVPNKAAGKAAKLVDANAASKIMGDTLEHATPVASVGWVVTTPKKDLAGRM